MGLLRKIGYLILGILATAVLSLILAWSISGENALLYAACGVAAGFLVYFAVLLVVNGKRGWKDEKTLRTRVRSDEALLLDVHARGKKYAADVYTADDAADTAEKIARAAEGGGTEADMEALIARCLGTVRITGEELHALAGKHICAGRALAAALSEQGLAAKNRVYPYGKEEQA